MKEYCRLVRNPDCSAAGEALQLFNNIEVVDPSPQL